jgi:aminoglycoside phosphotransferase (APT) family kinase protein
MCADRSSVHILHGFLGPILRRRLSARLGPVAGGKPTRLTGGRSATAFVLGQGPDAVVVKVTRAAPGPESRMPRDRGRNDTAPGHEVIAAIHRGDRPRPARVSGAPATGAPLFSVDPMLEFRVMAALARRGLAARPAIAIRHGPDICLAYPFQHGRTGLPPGPALARLLRRLHRLPRAALPHLPEPAFDHMALLAAARDRLGQEPDGSALTARVTAATVSARAGPHGGTVVLHGDPVPGNVVHGANGVRLIDWHSAHRGDPCHDLALALSPAMLAIHGMPPRTAAQQDRFLTAYGDPATAARFAATVALHHGLMIGHCLWRLARGDRAYTPALSAEIAALRALPEP